MDYSQRTRTSYTIKFYDDKGLHVDSETTVKIFTDVLGTYATYTVDFKTTWSTNRGLLGSYFLTSLPSTT